MKKHLPVIILAAIAVALAWSAEPGPLPAQSPVDVDALIANGAQLSIPRSPISEPVFSAPTVTIGPTFTIAPTYTIADIGGEVMTVKGLAIVRLPQANYSYERPERAEDVAVKLTTKDGRRWRAKWEEEKTSTP